MIIDLHTQIWSSPDQLGGAAAARLRGWSAAQRASLDAGPTAHERATSDVDGSVVIGFRSERLGANIPNQTIAQFVALQPGRRVGVAGIDPLAGDAIDDVDAAAKLGMIGVSACPASQGFHPAATAAMRVYEACASRGLAVFVLTQPPLTAGATLELARPAAWDEVARSFPTLAIVICGVGSPWIDETLALIGKQPRVFADLAGVASRPWQLYATLQNATSLGVMDKLLFGSGFPFDTPAKAIERLYLLPSFTQGTQLPMIPRASIGGMIERDSLACLGHAGRIAPATIDESAPDDDDDAIGAGRAASKDWRSERQTDENED